LRAFDKPIAMACLRLLTSPPLPPRPLCAVPRLERCISLFTSLLALREYLRFRFAILSSANFLDRAKAIAGAPRSRSAVAMSCHANNMEAIAGNSASWKTTKL
jgi:hypothetical protein